jgi:hypothetical protein
MKDGREGGECLTYEKIAEIRKAIKTSHLIVRTLKRGKKNKVDVFLGISNGWLFLGA